MCLCAESFRDGTAAKSHVCRDAAAARETDVKAAVARLAKLAAISEMQLETLQLQAEGSRIGQLGVSSGGIMGEFGVVHKFCSESHPCYLARDDSIEHLVEFDTWTGWVNITSSDAQSQLSTPLEYLIFRVLPYTVQLLLRTF